MSNILEVPYKDTVKIFQKKNFPSLTADKISVKQYWKKSLKDLGKDNNLKNYINYEKIYINSYVLNQGLIDVFIKLRRKYFIAVLSNQAKERKNSLEKKLNLLSYFNDNYLSSIIGYNKTDVRFFKKILKKNKLEAKECVLIDDEEKNLKEAKKLGFREILFKNNKKLIKDLKEIGLI
jgi:putative hydrolase of the HAD superfamily